MDHKFKVSILGAGSWGTSIANLMAKNGYKVNLWCFESEVAKDILDFNINKKYLPDVILDKDIVPTQSIHDAISESDIIFEAVPVQFLRNVLFEVKELVNQDQIWVALSKGIEKNTLLFPYDIIEQTFSKNINRDNIAVFGGPNFADQIAFGEPSAAVVASSSNETISKIKKIFLANNFRVLGSHDIIGVQVGGAFKNIIALFLGMLDGVGYKENTIALFFALGLDEISRLVEHLGGKRETVFGVSGLGDLVLSVIGRKSRNYKSGVLFGQGSTMQELLDNNYVLPEGFNTAKSICDIIKKESLDLPICNGIYEILFEGRSLRNFVFDYLKSV